MSTTSTPASDVLGNSQNAVFALVTLTAVVLLSLFAMIASSLLHAPEHATEHAYACTLDDAPDAHVVCKPAK